MRAVFFFRLVAACVIAAMTTPTASAQGSDPDVPRDLVVMINGKTPVGRDVLGAGLIVGQDEAGRTYIATARHVVYDDFSGPYEVTVSHFAARDQPVPAELIKHDFNENLDLAVIAAELPVTGPSAPLPVGSLIETPEIGEDVKLIGQTEGVPWAESPTTEKVGMNAPGRIVVQSDYGGPGLSGGAAFDMSGRIIGIALTDDRSIITILPLSVIAAQLELNDIPFLLEEGRKRIARMDTEQALSILNSAKAARDGSNQGQIEAMQLLVEQGYDFSGNDLSGIFLGGAHLANADLNSARLWLGDLTEADLSGADLANTGMRFADIVGATFVAANLSGSYAPFVLGHDADLREANLSRSVFIGSDLRNTNFSGANLSGAVFAFADLRNANFAGADLTDAHFVAAYLDGARFDGTVFANTNMLAARLDPFALSAEQRSGTCQVAADGRTNIKLVERWESNRFSSGYEYDDLNYNGYMRVYGVGMSLLPPCEDPPHEIAGFYPSSPGEVRLMLERNLIRVASREGRVLERLKGLFERFESETVPLVLFGPVQP